METQRLQQIIYPWFLKANYYSVKSIHAKWADLTREIQHPGELQLCTSRDLFCYQFYHGLMSVHDMHTPPPFPQECLRKLQIKPWWSIFAQDAPRPQGVFVPLCVLGGWDAWWSCCVTEPSGMSNQYKATESWLPQLSWVFKMNNIKLNLKVACKKVALTKSMSHIWFKILHEAIRI